MKKAFNYKGYDIVVIRKNNKHTYFRISDKMEVVVTTSISSSDDYIKGLIDKNIESVVKMIDNKKKKTDDKIYLFGEPFEKIMIPTLKDVEIFENRILYPSEKKFDAWYKKKTIVFFEELINHEITRFEEKIPSPTLKVRKMKSRWGVCNKNKKTITLNTELMKFSNEVIRYVIIHELSHFVVYDHSPKFWKLVEKYCPDYKKRKKILRLT